MKFNKTSASKLPVFMQDKTTNLIFQDIVKCIPKENEIYLIGGTVRNSLFHYYHSKKLPQRDYDILLIGNRKRFIDNLRKNNFVYGKIRRKKEIVLKRRKFASAKKISDFVVLDINSSNEKNIKKSIRENSNFTINCNALSLKHVNSEKWHKKIVPLGGAVDDIKNKQIRVNKVTTTDLFACIRFMSKGFKKPSPSGIAIMLQGLKKIGPQKFRRNVKKMIDYVGSEEKTKNIIKKLGIKKNILNFKEVKK